MVYKLSLENSK